MPLYNVIAGAAIIAFVLLSPAFREPFPPKLVDNLTPSCVADRARSEQFVRDHRSTYVASISERRNHLKNLSKGFSPKMSETSYFGCGQQDFSSNVIAIAFDSRLDARATHSRRTKPQMHHFMKRGKSPSGPRVLIIDNYEGRDWIGDSESSEHINRDVGVMAAEVAKKHYIHTSIFDCLTQVIESLLDLWLLPELIE